MDQKCLKKLLNSKEGVYLEFKTVSTDGLFAIGHKRPIAPNSLLLKNIIENIKSIFPECPMT